MSALSMNTAAVNMIHVIRLTDCLSHLLLIYIFPLSSLHPPLPFTPLSHPPLIVLYPLLLSSPPGETYSETYSHTDICIPCTMCTGLMRMQTPCTDSNNAICVCDYNYYLSEVSGRCEPCTVCPAGQGVLAHCEHNHDTMCEECIDDTYSDRDSSLDPCLPCTICDEGIEVELSACTPVSDSLCHSKRTNAHSRQHTHTQPAR